MQNRNALFAGLFIVLSIVAALVVLIGLKGSSHFFQQDQSAAISFSLADDIGGLAVGDEVRIGGAKVGAVKSIDFVQGASGQQNIRVNFSLPKKFTLHTDATVAIQSTVTGVSVLNFSSLGKGAVLAAGADLVGKPSALTALLNSGADITAIVQDVRAVTLPKVHAAIDSSASTLATYHQAGEAATGLIADARQQINPAMQHYTAAADAARAAMIAAGQLFGETKPDFRQTLANVRELTESAKQKLPAILDQVNSALAKLTSIIDETTAALQDVKKVAGNAQAISLSTRQIIDGNRGKIESMIASLKTTGDNLKGATAEVRRSPWRLLYKPTAGEMANLNLYDSARQFADGAGQLNDAALALRDALRDPQIDPAALKKLVDRLDQQFQSFDQVEQGLYRQVKQ